MRRLRAQKDTSIPFAANVLGPYLLGGLCFNTLRAARRPWIVNVAL